MMPNSMLLPAAASEKSERDTPATITAEGSGKYPGMQEKARHVKDRYGQFRNTTTCYLVKGIFFWLAYSHRDKKKNVARGLNLAELVECQTCMSHSLLLVEVKSNSNA